MSETFHTCTRSEEAKLPVLATMYFRDFPGDLSIWQSDLGASAGTQIYMFYNASWYRCNVTGKHSCVFLLKGALTDVEKNHIRHRSRKQLGDQVYLESFRDGAAVVLCLPVDVRDYLEFDIVNEKGIMQITQLHDKSVEILRQTNRKNDIESRRFFLCKTAMSNIPKTPKTSTCFFMSDGTFRYVPGAIRPMLD